MLHVKMSRMDSVHKHEGIVVSSPLAYVTPMASLAVLLDESEYGDNFSQIRAF